MGPWPMSDNSVQLPASRSGFFPVRLRYKFSKLSIIWAAVILDLLALTSACYISAASAPPLVSESVAVFGSFVGTAIATLWILGMYHIVGAGEWGQLKRAGLGAAPATLLLPTIVLLAGFDTDGLRLWLLWHGALSITALKVSGTVISVLSRRFAANATKLAIVGATELSRDHLKWLAVYKPNVELVGIFDDRTLVPDRISPVSVSGTVSDLFVLVEAETVDHVLIALPLSAQSRTAELARRFQALPVNVSVGFGQFALNMPVRRLQHVGTTPVLTLYTIPLSPADSIIKRTEDLVISGLALILLAPVFLLAVIAIKLGGPGPIFFKQQRYGYRNRIFELYKFRTMYVEATDLAGELLTQAGDPRITFVGRTLRKFSIDELPQLFNIIKGDMAIVGPRPHALAATAGGIPYTETSVNYALRQRVRPGLTGWAQVNGWRGPTETSVSLEARLDHDIFYVNNWSISFDMKILVLTPRAVLFPPPTAF